MTLESLQDLCLSWLDDMDAGYFTRPQLTVWLNNALKKVQRELLQSESSWYDRCVFTDLVIDQDSYSLPADFLKLRKMEIVTSGTVSSVSNTKSLVIPKTMIEGSAWQQGPACPAIYYLKKNCFVLRAIPDNTYPLILTYSYQVADMTAPGEAPDCPDEYQEYIAILATLDGFMKDQRDPSPFIEKRDEYKALMRQDANQRKVDLPRSVVVTEESGYEGY